MRTISSSQLRRLIPELPAGEPAYLGLARVLRMLITDGRLPLGARLPAERELARTLATSRTTTSAAYRTLRREGYLNSRRGAGTFATFPPDGVPVAAMPYSTTEPRGLIDLSIAAPPARSEAVLAAAAEAVEQLPRYLHDDGYHVVGIPELREAVADRYRGRGLETSADEIMVTSGAQGAIALLARTLLTPGAAVLVESPTYPNALDAFRASSARIVTVPVGNDGWDDELLEASFRQTLPHLAYVIPDFHNPTGALMPSATRATAARAARHVDALLIVDECYLGLSLSEADGALPEPIAAHDPARVISVGSLSKSTWGGLRVGWIRAAPSMIQRLALARPSLDLANPLLEQLIAVRLLERGEDVAAERGRAFRAHLDVLAGALTERVPEWRFTEPQGGLSLWVTLDRPSTSLAAAAVAEGVRIVPGPRFGTDGTLERFIRIPFVLPPATLRDAVARLARAAEHVPPFAPRERDVAYVI